MVATSLPFWMQHQSRAMMPFQANAVLRLGATVAPEERRLAAAQNTQADRTTGFTIEFCEAQAVVAYEEAWRALAGRALEPNVFLEPGFALAAIRHFPPNQRPTFLLAWSEDDDGRAILAGLCALGPRASLPGLGMAACWSHAQATLSAPLLDRTCAASVLEAMLGALKRRAPDWSGLLLQGVDTAGPLWSLLKAKASAVAVIEQRSRAVLRRRTADAGPAHPLGSKQAKELRRQGRRMAADKACLYRSATTAEEVRLATERFLHLEAQGWKGGRGTALLSDAGLAAFTRAMTRQLARDGLCRIDSLELDGKPVAMGIVLRSGDRAYFWKTAYDERYGRHSPGKQFADRLGALQLADPAIALTDSCAVPNHPMIDHVWSDRATVADVLVAGRATSPARLARVGRLLVAWRRGRGLVKAVRRAAWGVLGRR